MRQNVKAAGIDQSRVRVIEADMRKIPAPDNTFNAVISSYAIDHLDRAGIKTALHEVNRVLAPGGDFLLMVIRADAWLKT
ncbi:class I SAM-dependent methyltransferase, partial [Acinetobacter baumannii]